MPVGEVAAIGGVAEEIAAQPVNRIGDEAIGEQVCNINLNSAYPLKLMLFCIVFCLINFGWHFICINKYIGASYCRRYGRYPIGRCV